MQSRGAIKFFAILFALVCLFQLSFTFVTYRVESKAEDYAAKEVWAEKAMDLSKGDMVLKGYLLDSITRSRYSYFLDSMNNEVVFNILLRKYTFREVKERELNLGLDLKGGNERHFRNFCWKYHQRAFREQPKSHIFGCTRYGSRKDENYLERFRHSFR
jgi:hypothetical protein